MMERRTFCTTGRRKTPKPRPTRRVACRKRQWELDLGTRHRRWPRELLYKELKEEHVYNLLTDNRVIKANQMAKRISQEEREKAFKQAFTAAAGSVLQDVLNGREVDGHAAVSQSAGAGAGPLTSHTVHGVTGSSPIAGGTGACVGATSHGGRWPSSDGSGCSRSCSLRSSQRDQLRTQSWCGCWDDHRCWRHCQWCGERKGRPGSC